jgi:alpha-1,2-mannosyltransferase
MQLRIWADALKKIPANSKFYMIGSVRGPDDERIVEELKDLAKKLGIEDKISFEINKDMSDVHSIFKQAKVAIHTMKFEHFGIAVCEMMSAGIITIAHDSGNDCLTYFISWTKE